jgi:hypothetical protein
LWPLGTRQLHSPASCSDVESKSDGGRSLSPLPYRFGFSRVDHTDKARLETVKPMYDLLARPGLRATKMVWPPRCDDPEPPMPELILLRTPAMLSGSRRCRGRASRLQSTALLPGRTRERRHSGVLSSLNGSLGNYHRYTSTTIRIRTTCTGAWPDSIHQSYVLQCSAQRGSRGHPM